MVFRSFWNGALPLLSWRKALNQVLTKNIKIDVVVGEEENADSLRDILRDQHPVKLLLTPTIDSLFETAWYFLTAKNFPSVNILIDPLNADNLVKMSKIVSFQNNLDRVLITPDSKWTLVRSGVQSKWLPQGQQIDVWPVSQNTMISTSGFEEDLDNTHISEVISLFALQDGQAKVISNLHPFWWIEQL